MAIWANFNGFDDFAKKVGSFAKADVTFNLTKILEKQVTVVDLSEHQKQALSSINILTIGDALKASEETFQQARYIGPVRSRQIMNIVTASALEYLSG